MKIRELLIILEARCSMGITAPASKEQLNRVRDKYPSVYNFLGGLYEISDGIEINIPGTVFYSVDEVVKLNQDNKSHNIIVGHLNFGDDLVINETGKMQQIDHETGEVFLEWNTIEEFLSEELASLV